MIIKLDPTNQMLSSHDLRMNLNYHEEKVQKGESRRISFLSHVEFAEEYKIDTTFCNSTGNNNKQILSWDIPFSFPKEDNIDDYKFEKILNEFREEFGFTDRPFIVYRDYDKTNYDHYHLLISHSDYSGTPNLKLQEKENGFYRKAVVKYSRELEKEHGLKRLKDTKTVEKDNSRLKNAEKYSYQNAFLKELKENPKKIEALLSDSIKLEHLKAEKMPNRVFISNIGVNQDLIQYLYKSKHHFKSNKSEIIGELNTIYNRVDDRDQFIKAIIANDNLRYRIHKPNSKNETLNITYSLKLEDGKYFHIHQNKLPRHLAFSNIKSENRIKYIDSGKQAKYLRNQINQALLKSKDYESFKNYLLTKNIKVHESSNSGGVYGISFSSLNIDNPIVFKGSEIDRYTMTYGKITKHFENKKALATGLEREDQDKNQDFNKGKTQSNFVEENILMPGMGFSSAEEMDDEEFKKTLKKKKRKRRKYPKR